MSACNLTQPILGTECIGDSLYNKINPNFENLDNAVCALSTNFLNVVDSTTVDLAFSNNTRTLSANVIAPWGFKNKLINGNFDIWQRGTSGSASNNNGGAGFFVADRWGFSPNLGGTVVVSRQPFAYTQTDVPNNPTYHLRFQSTVGSTAAPLLFQRLENVRLLAGKTVTFSFYAKSNTPISVVLGYSYVYGTVPPNSSQDNYILSTVSIGTTWTKYVVTTTLPAIPAGRTIANPELTSFQLVFNFPTSSTFTFDIAQAQLEEGPIATTFEQRPIGTELALCQRYFEIGGIYIDNNNGTADLVWRFDYSYKANKRTFPTLAFWSNPWFSPPSGPGGGVALSPAGFTAYADLFACVVSVAVPSPTPAEYNFSFSIDAEV
jgi:hypothetical protein